MRQLRTLLEGGTTLVIDEQESQPVRRDRLGHAEDPRLQELGFAGASGAADQRVRAMQAQVQLHGFARALSNDRGQRNGGDLLVWAPGSAVDDRVRGPPSFDERVGIVRQFLARQVHVGDRAGQVRVVVDGDARVKERRECPAQASQLLVGHAVHGHVLERARGPDIADGRLSAIEGDERAARRRQLGERRGDPHDIDSPVGAELSNAVQTRSVHQHVVDEDDHRGNGIRILLG